MELQIFLILEPQQVLIWTCVFVFIATSLITLCGILKWISIDPAFLNKLFIALILEIVAIGVLAFKNSFEPRPIVEFAKIVSPKSGFSVGENKSIFIDGAYRITEGERVEMTLFANDTKTVLQNNAKENGIFSTVVDSARLDGDGESMVELTVIKDSVEVISDKIVLKR